MSTTAVRNKSRVDILFQGREALAAQTWGTAYSQLSAADAEEPLSPEDLEGLALAGYLTGRELEGRAFLSRAHQAYLERDDRERAARCATWLAFALLNSGDFAQASGWLGRARRLLEACSHCVEHGYVLIPAGILAMREGNAADAYENFIRAAQIGEQFKHSDLTTLARNGQGRVLIHQGEIKRGISLLDEAMVAVTAGEVSPAIAGGIYCSVLEACGEILDFRRAQEWTSALDQWCASHPEIIPFRSHCQVRRAELLQLQGDWSDAFREAQSAFERLSLPEPRPAIGSALYRIGDLHRLRGEFAEAENAYRQASQWQRLPQPGLALLRLAQGQLESACAVIKPLLDQVRDPGPRSRVLEACIEIALAEKDLEAARASADELARIARELDAPVLYAKSDHAFGAIFLVEGNLKESLDVLQRALAGWQELSAPYEAARVRVLIAQAYRRQGNNEAAEFELAAARAVFEKLGARPDVARVDEMLQKPAAKANGILTDREVQVLKLIASGATNRAIAAKLKISEKTVARHISNIFNKLDLPSRAAATAYAYKHQLL